MIRHRNIKTGEEFEPVGIRLRGGVGYVTIRTIDERREVLAILLNEFEEQYETITC